MFVTTHVLTGAAVGLATRRPAAAVLAGVASHLALDAVPHWGGVPPPAFLAAAVTDGLVGLAALGLLVHAAPLATRLAVLAGTTGAALPDLDKPAVLFLGVNPVPAPFQHLHEAVQREAPGWWPVEVVAAALAASAALTLLHRARQVERTRAGPPRHGAEA